MPPGSRLYYVPTYIISEPESYCLRQAVPILNWTSFNASTWKWTLQNMTLNVTDFAGECGGLGNLVSGVLAYRRDVNDDSDLFLYPDASSCLDSSRRLYSVEPSLCSERKLLLRLLPETTGATIRQPLHPGVLQHVLLRRDEPNRRRRCRRWRGCALCTENLDDCTSRNQHLQVQCVLLSFGFRVLVES